MKCFILLTCLFACVIGQTVNYQTASAYMKDSWTSIFPDSTFTLALPLNDFAPPIGSIGGVVGSPERGWFDSVVYQITRLTSNTDHSTPPSAKPASPTVISLPQPLLRWLPLGVVAPPSTSLLSPFEAIEVHVNSSVPIHLFWADTPHTHLNSLWQVQRLRCGSWLWPFVSSSVDSCVAVLPRYGWMAPFGRTYIGFIPDSVVAKFESGGGSLWSSLSLSPSSNTVSLTVRLVTVTDYPSMARTIIGVILFLIAPTLASSRLVHLVTGMSLGAGGIAFFVLLIAFYLIPGKRKTLSVAALLGLSATLVNYAYEGIISFAVQNSLLTFSVGAFGAIVGGVIAYRFRVGEETQDLILLFTRVVAAVCILTGPHNGIVSSLLLLTLVLRAWWKRSKRVPNERTSSSSANCCWRCLCCCRRGDQSTVMPLMFDPQTQVPPDFDEDDYEYEYDDDGHDDGHGEMLYDDEHVDETEEDEDDLLEDAYTDYRHSLPQSNKGYTPLPAGAPLSSPRSRLQFEVESRILTDQQVRLLRREMRRNGSDYLARLSGKALRAVTQDLIDHESSDEEWEATGRSRHHDVPIGSRYVDMRIPSGYQQDLVQRSPYLRHPLPTRKTELARERLARRNSDEREVSYSRKWDDLFKTTTQ